MNPVKSLTLLTAAASDEQTFKYGKLESSLWLSQTDIEIVY